MRRLLFVCFLLAGCGTVPASKPETTPAVVCATVALKQYDLKTEQALATRVQALEATDPLVGVIGDYHQLRAEVQALNAKCKG